MECILCKKILNDKSGLIKHYIKSKPCINDSLIWLKNKEKYLKKNELIKPNYKSISFNKEQLEFIEFPIKDLKLLGIPGGGKSRSIIEKIFRHKQRGEYINNTEYLILSFSKRSRFDFIEKGKVYSKLFTRDNVKTLHSLSKTIINCFINKNTGSLDTIILIAGKLIDEKSDQELRNVKCLSSLKSIYLDEAQDISESQYNMIINLKNKLK